VYPHVGNYSTWLGRKAERLDVEKKHERKKAKAMQEELSWIRQGARVSAEGNETPERLRSGRVGRAYIS